MQQQELIHPELLHLKHVHTKDERDIHSLLMLLTAYLLQELSAGMELNHLMSYFRSLMEYNYFQHRIDIIVAVHDINPV